MKPSSTTSEQTQAVIDALESDIMFGRLKPHQELIEDALMARFDAKRHVVRSALQALIQRQMVVKPYARSARVKDFTSREVEEIYSMRALLQREAIRIMPMPVDTKKLMALKLIHDQYTQAVHAQKSPEAIHQLNDTFHTALFGLCGQNELCKAIAYYRDVCNPIRSYGIVDRDWLMQAVAQHSAMIQALESANRPELERLVVDHMTPTRMRWESSHPNL